MSYDLTKRDLRILGAYLDFGTCDKAGKQLGIQGQTVKNALYTMRMKAHVATNQQLVYEYGAQLRRYRRKQAA